MPSVWLTHDMHNVCVYVPLPLTYNIASLEIDIAGYGAGQS